ncbi:hypothetical protein B1B04_10470 [Lysinibacillus sp. KCTC 33748]|uniref:DUF3883 domain-containing protein n=1 Tax=unclassified Lysinibacillus TaxID=2636778 RepID=UPI0009A69D87|nr:MULTISPECIES: DUF3883 domain-containing protein [unclassified Lysinibacillus]OXS74029.1 hypothetical protein B1B04_10470 [Lysinibacillus sp. KCTC 33748]SKB69470.1 protein of unknown function [Lysinibacillus sp. AC-3]
MSNFIVMQNATHEEEIIGGYMWSPQKNKNGNSNHAYERMTTIKTGNKIYSCYDQAIRAVGIATSDCYIAEQPHELQEKNLWSDEGYKVDVDFTILEHPIMIRDVWGDMESDRPQKYAAFQENGRGNQAYLFPCPEAWASLFDSFLNEDSPEAGAKAELIEDGEINEETFATSSYEQGESRVSNRGAGSTKKRGRVVSQEQLQKDLKKRKKIGDIAEQKVFEYVKKKVIEVFGEQYGEQVEHVAQTQGDGLGYDITAFDYLQPQSPPRPIKIEVKGTTSTSSSAVYSISYPELEKFIQYKDEMWLVRVYGVGKKSEMKMEIDNDFSSYHSVSDLLTRKYAYIPSTIDVYGTRVESNKYR